MHKFKDSALAHRYLDDLKGIEVGGSAHNPFNLPNCINVDYTDSMTTIFKKAEYDFCGEKLKVDVVAYGEKLPFKDNEYDYVISSHVIEHIFDPIAAMLEWQRVIKNGGYIFTIAPLKQFVPGEIRPITTLQELIDRHNGLIKPEDVLMWDNSNAIEDNALMAATTTEGMLSDNETGHFTVFDLQLFVDMCKYLNMKVIKTENPDTKVGNGFTVLVLINK